MKTTMRKVLRYGLVAAFFTGGASVALAADPPQTADVLGKLHQSDQKEIEAGKMARKNGQSKQVQEYGKMLVKDHGDADKKVSALAKQEKVDLAASTPPAAPGMNDMGAGAFDDTKFARGMLDDHKKDIAEVTEARDNTNDPKLKKLLSDLLPTLQKHENAAQKILDTEGKK